MVNMKRLLYNIGSPALFLLLSAAYLWQPILTGRVFLPTDLAFRYDQLWKVYENDPGRVVAQNHILSDVSDYYYPYADFAIDRLSEGHFPLWNPYILTGTPLFASAQAAVLDPINLLTYLAGPNAYWTWAAWLRLALIGFTMYGFVRALGRSRPAALASGVVFMACGFVMAWLNYSVVTSLAWMPALFWATTRLLQTGCLIWAAATAMPMGFLLLGGHPETQFLVGLAWGAFVLYNLVQSPKSKVQSRTMDDGRWTIVPYHRPSSIVHRPGLLAVAVALGLSLAAVQVVTFVEFLLSSHALSARAGGPAPFDLGQTALRLAALFYSNFTGTPLEGNYWARPPLNFNEQTGYIGTLAAVLAAMGAIYWWRRDRVVPFFAVAGLLSVLFAVQAPGFNLIKALPIFNVGHGVRWVIVYSFCGATLAAYGIDALLDIKPRTRRFRSAALWLASAALATFGIAFLFYVGIKDYGWDLSWQTLISHENMARLFHPTHRTMYWPAFFVALGAVVALAWWRGWLRARAGTTLLVLLLYADLWVFGSRYNPVTPAQEIFPATQTTRFLAENLGHDRFVGLIGAMRPNAAMLFGFRDLRGYEDLIDEPFAQLYAPVFNALDVSGKDSLYLTRDEHRLLSMAGVRYVLTVRKPRVDGDPAPYLFMFQEGRLATYENLQALPRAYVAFNATTAPNAWRTPDFDPRRTVVLEAGVQPLEGANLDLEAATVVWLKDDPDEVALQATLPQPGYLILSDNYAPGWEATLDGQPAPILRANTVYRAVAVPAGPHTVTFQYRPLTFYIAAAISALAALVLLAIAVLHFVKRKT